MRGDKCVRADLLDHDLAYDVEIGGLRFLSGVSLQNPYQRALAKVLRAQMDNNQNPDSNSLAGWWIRGQGDWSAGAGRIYQEPPTDEFALRQFDSSAGVDPFTDPGFLTLLPKARLVTAIDGGDEVFVVNAADARYVVSGLSVVRIVGDTTATVTGLGTSATAACMFGDKLVVFAEDGIYTTTDLKLTNVLPTTKGAIRGDQAKQRVIAWQGSNLYEVTLPDLPGDFDELKPIYTHPDPQYVWSGVSNAPQAILLSGYAASGSDVWALTLDTSGKLPDLAAPFSIAEFPSSEKVLHIRSYLGAYIAISTNKGMRVGTISGTQMTYGPLIGSPLAAGPLSTFDRFVIYPTADAGDGRGGLVKVDLSLVDADGRAAWATFLRVGADPVLGQAVLDARDAVMVSKDGNSVSVWHSQEANGLEAGWIQGSWVRYGTLERKNFIDLTVITEPNPNGTIEVSFCDDEGIAFPLGPLVGQETTFNVGRPYTMADGAVRLDITPDVNGLGPKVNSWSLRALPTPKGRSEMVQLILNCYDMERDMHGVTIGYAGRSAARWHALLDILQDGASVQVNELSSGMSYMGTCEDLSFTQTSPPAPGSGFGGVIAVTLRVVG